MHLLSKRVSYCILTVTDRQVTSLLLRVDFLLGDVGGVGRWQIGPYVVWTPAYPEGNDPVVTDMPRSVPLLMVTPVCLGYTKWWLWQFPLRMGLFSQAWG